MKIRCQMAHFVYSQDGYFLQLAESVASTEGTVQYKYNNELAEGFQMAWCLLRIL